MKRRKEIHLVHFSNVLPESNTGIFKTLAIWPVDLENNDEVECATLEWVEWFNDRRLLEPIRDVPLAEFERAVHD